mmetsp:Transcript_32753/g.51196  ORF Transcript_32753/g.51196 Transcript_32753/m.51196 type:complete len:261 (-) Transcript_32753:18-800(-)
MTLRNQFVLQVRTRDAKTHSITVKREWTIGMVKDHLKKELEKTYGEDSETKYGQLSNADMRLLCKGKLLNDEDVVSEHLQPDVACHLVIRSQLAAARNAERSTPAAEQPSRSLPSATSNSIQNISNILRNAVSDALANRNNDATEQRGGITITFPNNQGESNEASSGQRDDQRAADATPHAGENPEPAPRRRRIEGQRDGRNSVRSAALPSSIGVGNVSNSTVHLSNYNLPPISSVHLHIHASVSELPLVASRAQSANQE